MHFRSGEIEDGVTNMARDFDLLAICKEEGIAARVYGWTEPWITLGKFQNPSTDLKPDCPIPWVMRPTGGRAVLHGHDITIGLALSFSSIASGDQEIAVLSRSVRRMYRIAVAPIISALRSCGIDAVLGEEIKGQRSGPKSADCFAQVSANDVVDRRTLKKACGVAMMLTKESVLVQASIPISEPIVDPSLVYQEPAQVIPISVKTVDFSKEFEFALLNFLNARNPVES